MKRIFLLTMLCVMALSWGISHAGVASTGHDLTVLGSGGSGGWNIFATVQVCVFCHTPHGARTDFSVTTFWNSTGWNHGAGSGSGGMLLWNRNLSGSSVGGPGTGMTALELYSSSSFNAASGRLNAYTLMCLSCHDGVGALNVVKNYPGDIPDPVNGPIPNTQFPQENFDQIGDQFNSPGNWGPNIGENTTSGTTLHLANDHPVSINYETAYNIDGSSAFQPKSTDAMGAYVFNQVVRLFPDPDNPSIYNQVECSSCHDVHNDTYEPFLVMSNAGSALCTSCHIK